MRIGLDIDGVMYQWDKTARYMLREVLPGAPYKNHPALLNDTPHWDGIQEVVSAEAWRWLWSTGVRMGLFRHGHLYPGTIQAVRRLAELGDVVVITHRPKSAVHDTLSWLSYQNLPLSGLHILSGHEPKSSVQPQCDVYVDDKYLNFVDLADNTKGDSILMLRPWSYPKDMQHSDERIFDLYNHGVGVSRDGKWDYVIDYVRSMI